MSFVSEGKLLRSMIVVASVFLLLLDNGAKSAPSSSGLLPSEISGPRYEKILKPNAPSQQALAHNRQGELRHSNSSFPGDETGDSPFFYCPESNPETDLFEIYKMVLNPNPPRINYPYVFHAHGNFRETILDKDKSFRLSASVRNEDRDGIDFTFEKNVCQFLDMEPGGFLEMDGRSTGCPPAKGNATIIKPEFVYFGIGQVRYPIHLCQIMEGH